MYVTCHLLCLPKRMPALSFLSSSIVYIFKSEYPAFAIILVEKCTHI